MNSLNLVSRLGVTPPPSPPRSRSGSVSQRDATPSNLSNSMSADAQDDEDTPTQQEGDDSAGFAYSGVDEKTRLLGGSNNTSRSRDSEWRLPKRITEAVLYGVQGVYLTITAPFRYVVACFYDKKGAFSAVLPIRSFKELIWRRNRRSSAQAMAMDSHAEKKAAREESHSERTARKASTRRSPSVDSASSFASAGSSDGEADDSPARHTRSRSSASQHHQTEDHEGAPQRTSIRIKVSNDESLRKRKASKSKRAGASSLEDVALVASALKSPTSALAGARLTKYPRAPAPPRPLVPRRQPSYALSYNPASAATMPRKTLIIDLDETLIHSMAKGGRMSTGHMVEVRLATPASVPGSAPVPPNIPILYYVHERPFCHDFLRKVSAWYNCVIFTASVQEYADPVIDWLERERKYFTARYYRQHCTLRGGAYIKDLSVVEPDLSRVAILDNSPVSYGFNEDNAIPIEGWISDPTDSDLLHLVPFLEALQYVTDVRALLALRQGQTQHM